MSNEAIQAAWADHASDPEGVAQRLGEWVARAGEDEVQPLAGLVVHVFGEHLGRWDEGLRLLSELVPRAGTDPANVQAVWRATATLRCCAGDGDLDDLMGRFGAERPGNEARVLAVAAAAVGAQGRTADAARWLVRAASMTYALPDAHPAVRAVAVTGNNLAVAMEQRAPTTPEDVSLLRSAASLARVAWERAGTWLEVERAEYRLAMSSLVLGEPFAAVAHAEACHAICKANRAAPLELFFAEEARALAFHGWGDAEAARAARDEAAGWSTQVEPDLKGWVAETLGRLDAALGTPPAT